VLRPGGHDWVLKRVPIVHHEGDGELRCWTEMDAAVPVGSRFMCWVDYTSGFLVSNMAELCCLSSAVTMKTTVLEIFYRLNFIGNDL
jgi:hypothetical protein